ncbi:MAG: hypothetical protein NZM25_02805 [Leptospiraceae bacterium]|nr:hypothetical protein [Leptospiraceae bacterium]MDW8307198.1 hypothetical protein [Leptospiraceae bacterium]
MRVDIGSPPGVVFAKWRFYISAFLMLFSHPLIAQEEEAKKEEMAITGDRTLGSITIRLSYGLYNFETVIRNPATQDERRYSLAYPWFMIGGEVAVRIGRDETGFHDNNKETGFIYYRSNRGLFTDMEFGFRTFAQEEDSSQPTVYKYQSTNLGSQTYIVDLGATQEVNGFQIISYDPNANNGAGLKDGITTSMRIRYGGRAARVSMFYFNNYYHLTPLNFLLNFGSSFRWYDGSLGVSMRAFYYSDYSDPERMLENRDDNTNATFALVLRQYFQFHPRVRLRSHYYYPFVSHLARSLRNHTFNEEEHVFDTGIDIYVISYIYVSVGYEYHLWRHNPKSPRRLLRYSPVFTARQGYENVMRTSGEFYGAVAVDIPLL